MLLGFLRFIFLSLTHLRNSLSGLHTVPGTFFQCGCIAGPQHRRRNELRGVALQSGEVSSSGRGFGFEDPPRCCAAKAAFTLASASSAGRLEFACICVRFAKFGVDETALLIAWTNCSAKSALSLTAASLAIVRASAREHCGHSLGVAEHAPSRLVCRLRSLWRTTHSPGEFRLQRMPSCAPSLV